MLNPDRIEVIPSPTIVNDVRERLPTGTEVTVTALRRHDIHDTVNTAIALSKLGFGAIPHLAATQVASPPFLRWLLDRLEDSPIATLFIIGGDGAARGDAYPDGGALLREIRDRTAGRFRLGVAAYPEGHQGFDVGAGLGHLRRKAPDADFAVTQLCFDGSMIGEFAHRVAAEGIALPLWLGVPARISAARLARLAVRIGVGPAASFARKGTNRRLLMPYEPNELRRNALAQLRSGDAAVAGFHVYSFNALRALDDTESAERQ